MTCQCFQFRLLIAHLGKDTYQYDSDDDIAASPAEKRWHDSDASDLKVQSDQGQQSLGLESARQEKFAISCFA